MTKYMVLVPNAQPEYVEADKFAVDEGHTLHLYTNDRESASFVGWLGIKEVGNPASMTIKTTTTNPTQADFIITGKDSDKLATKLRKRGLTVSTP